MICSINSVRSTKQWWSLVNRLKTNPRRMSTNILIDDFRTYFLNLLNPSIENSSFQYAELNIQVECLDKPISLIEVCTVIDNVKLKKAPGEDKVTYECLKDAPTVYLEILTTFYNRILNSANICDNFKSTIFLPIHKKGDVNTVSNYRGIGNMNAISKIFMGVLHRRLETFIENEGILNEFQAGFRKNYSTADNVYNLSCIINYKQLQGKKVYAFFVDFKAAFDSIDRSALFYKMTNMGVSSKFLRVLRELYKNTTAKVWHDQEMSEEFEMKSGVKQGCLLSPMLFSLMLNDLHDVLKGGLQIVELNIRLLMYADDIIILADSPEVLQKMINRLSEYCQLWNLVVNLQKSQILIFGKTTRPSHYEKWFYRSTEIEIVKSYQYLGVLLTSNLSLKKHFDQKTKICRSNFQNMWTDFINKITVHFSEKVCLFNAVARSLYAYCASVWGFQYFEDSNKFQRYYLKLFLKIPEFTPTYITYLEAKIEPLHLYTLEQHMNYIFKTLFVYHDDRLPNILSKLMLNKKLYWVRQWCDLWPLGEDTNWIYSIRDGNTWRRKIKLQINYVKQEFWNDLHINALNSSHGIYKHLVGEHSEYIYDTALKENHKTWILKARAGLVGLNSQVHSTTTRNTCSLCNLGEEETITHFLGRCPMLSEIRRSFLNLSVLSELDVINLLNGYIVEWRTRGAFHSKSPCTNSKMKIFVF